MAKRGETAGGFSTVDAAEAAFYDAFQCADLSAMMEVWADDDDIECVHPTGPRAIGREAIRESWMAIFRNFPGMEFRVAERRRFHAAELAVNVVHEHIRVGAANEFGPPVIVTNVYRFSKDGWRMVLHHASPSPAKRETREPKKTVH